jgi:MoaA/NifB/PqqE/SkfB family radical SAM enzyme
MSEVAFPKIVSMAMTSRCNLRCVMCDHGIRNVAKQDFQESLFENIGDFIGQATMVDLTGLGEPLLSGLFWRILDRYPVVDPSKDDDFFLTFNSNGTLFSEANIDRILRSRIYKIRVSIDSADQGTFSAIRGTSLKDIVEGTRRLIEKRNSLGQLRPRIGIEMTAMKKTIETVPAMIDLCKEIGADFLEVWSLNALPQHMTKDWIVTKKDWTFSYDEQSLGSTTESDLQAIVNAYHDYADQQGVLVASCVGDIRKMSNDFPRDIGIVSLIVGDSVVNSRIFWRAGSIRCDLPWQELRITYEGDVFACCWQSSPIGNIRDSTLASVWDGDAMKQLREELIEGKIPQLCSGAACSHVKGRAAPVDKAPVIDSPPGPLIRAWRAVDSAFRNLNG